jgi:V-type H+-transporting ATPase subunit d
MAFTDSVLFIFFPRYSYMIDNIILLITGTLHERTITELIPKCHPLGSFEEMASINIASTPVELYNAVLVDTPLGKKHLISHCKMTS